MFKTFEQCSQNMHLITNYVNTQVVYSNPYTLDLILFHLKQFFIDLRGATELLFTFDILFARDYLSEINYPIASRKLLFLSSLGICKS